MAARLNRLHSDICKARIKASQLINRLQNHALAKKLSAGTEMTESQVSAAKFLLGKIIADPPRILAGYAENPLIPAQGLRPTELPEAALLAIAAGRKAYYKDGELIIEDAPAKTNGSSNGGNGAVH